MPEFEYSDSAVSGTKLKREGLDALLRAAKAGEFQVLYMHSLSRLARESVITMPMLKRLVYVYKVRIVSVSEGIDSARDNWEVIASVLSLLHERYIKELAENTFRGQEGTVLAGNCVGDHRFGYDSVPIPGSEVNRRGKGAKPRKAYVIDEIQAAWVIRIFYWFTVEKRSIRWITRELNKQNAPKDHRATTKEWWPQQVNALLSCPKYVGIWPWGEMKNTRDPETGMISQEPRSEEECEKWTRHFEHLRIIDQETFDKAQEILQENYDKYAAARNTEGRFTGNRNGRSDGHPRHLLSGIIKCECGSNFFVGGADSQYMFCKKYHLGVCACKTTLRRDRAERMLLDAIGQNILRNADWFRAVLAQLIITWREHEDQVPMELSSAERALVEIERKISRLIDSIENGLANPDTEARLNSRRSEPNADWLRGKLEQLGSTLSSETPAAAYALRDLVGGEIHVREIREEGKKRFYLQGRFTIDSNSLINSLGQSSNTSQDTGCEEPSRSEEIVIDFVDLNPLDAESEVVKELYDKGLMCATIGNRLGFPRSKVTKLLRHWFKLRGLPFLDGRARRATLKRKHTEPPMYQQISERVKQLCDEGLLLGEIGEQLGCDRNTITSAHVFWYESRGLEAPDGRTRRKSLSRKVSKKK